MTEFKPGDVVMMKMGGPHMTVEAVEGERKLVRCIWFDREQRLQRDAFDDFALTHVRGFP